MVVALVVSSCTGKIGDARRTGSNTGAGTGGRVLRSVRAHPGPGGSSVPGAGGSTTTTPGALVIGASVLHRLTPVEYSNTIRDLLGATVDIDDASRRHRRPRLLERFRLSGHGQQHGQRLRASRGSGR